MLIHTTNRETSVNNLTGDFFHLNIYTRFELIFSFLKSIVVKCNIMLIGKFVNLCFVNITVDK